MEVEDFTVSHSKFNIQKCDDCSFLFTNPRPDATHIGTYYESQDYISHHDEATDLMSRVYTAVRNYTISQKIKLINKHQSTPGKLLDIGCGTGIFMQAAQNASWKVDGTEPDPGARKVAQSRVGETIYETINAPELQTKRFDIITLWHVLEHVHLLNETITWLHEHLNDNGKLIIAVPNPESDDASRYGKFWAAYDVPRHLYHFSKNVMSKLMAKHKFKVETILPMWFDSFYVSMLSTKYKAGKVGIPESVIAGLKSNMAGTSSVSKAYNTSSLIYIISKV